LIACDKKGEGKNDDWNEYDGCPQWRYADHSLKKIGQRSAYNERDRSGSEGRPLVWNWTDNIGVVLGAIQL
jgi:hypothetical protein